MSGNPKKIDHDRHPDVTGSAPKKTAEEATNKRNQHNRPDRYLQDTGLLQTDPWRQRQSLKKFRQAVEHQDIRFRTAGIIASCPRFSQCLPTFPGPEY